MGGRGGSPSPSALGQAQKKAAAPSAALSADDAATQTLRQLYNELNQTVTSKGGDQFKVDIVSLTRMRDRLNDMGWSREKQDSHLMRLQRARKILMIPESNQKTLSQKDRDAAIHFGGQDKHLMQWLRD